MLTQAEAFVSARLPSENVSDVYLNRYPNRTESLRAVRQALASAEPALADPDSASFTLVAAPAESADEFRSLVREAAPDAEVARMASTDEIIFYREGACDLQQVLDHLGPAAEEAYHQLLDTEHFTPHTRIDITEWCDLANLVASRR